MTNREFFTLVSAGTLTDEVKAFATTALVSLDEKNEKRKVSPSALKAAAERDAFRSLVLDALSDNSVNLMTSAQVSALVGESVPKTAAALSALVKDGSATMVEFKPNGKGRKVHGYFRTVKKTD